MNERSGVELVRPAKIKTQPAAYGGLMTGWSPGGGPGYVGFSYPMEPYGITVTLGAGSDAKITINQDGIYQVWAVLSVMNDGGMVDNETSFFLELYKNGGVTIYYDTSGHLHKLTVGFAALTACLELSKTDYLQLHYDVWPAQDPNIMVVEAALQVLKVR